MLEILFYNFAIYVYVLLIRIASLFNYKAKLWIKGRIDWKSKLKEKVENTINRDKSIYWFHCASVGEFEQARPLIEKIKLKDIDSQIILSFFSPSGFELRKNYNLADIVFYLPTDTKKNADFWLNTIQPDVIFFIKYEFWYHFLNQCKRKKIPVYLISANFRTSQPFFKFYGSLYRKILTFFSMIFVQNDSSKDLLTKIGIKNVEISGDTRFDRVFDIKNSFRPINSIEKFILNSKVIVCGSTWYKDEIILRELYLKYLSKENWKMIIAPHEIDKGHITKMVKSYKENFNIIQYSNIIEQNNLEDYEILVIDNIGMLSSLYHYADLAFVGGGFSKGIHNILEASVYGIPVFFGPDYQKFAEAKELVELQTAFSIKNAAQFYKKLVSINYDAIKIKNDVYFKSKSGVTDKIHAKLFS